MRAKASWTCRSIVFVIAMASLDGLTTSSSNPLWGEESASRLRPLKVSFGGRSFTPHVISFSGSEIAQPGDLIDVGYYLKLRSDREFDIAVEGRHGERVFVVGADKTKRLVGVKVFSTYADREFEKKVVINPLEGLSTAELRGLWGVEIDHWSAAIAKSLSQLDTEQTCVTVGDGAASSPHTLPALPAGLRYLRVYSRSSDGLMHLQELSKQTQLKFLAVGLVARVDFDCALIVGAARLQYFDGAGLEVKNSSSLAKLSSLRYLNLRYSDNLADVKFASELKQLENLIIDHSKVADLSPLNGLPKLRSVNADQSPVMKLPQAMPALRDLHVMSSKLTDADVKTFQQGNLKCETFHRWLPALQRALTKATKLRIRTGGTCHRDIASEQTQFETADAAVIKVLAAGIQIEENRSGGHCLCCGDPSLEFYEGDKLIVTLGFHHAQAMRWPEIWPGDGTLSAGSAEFLIRWLADHNVPGPLRERERAQEQAGQEQRKLAQAVSGFPAALVEEFRTGARNFSAVLKKLKPEPTDQIAVYLHILGTSNGSWSSTDSVEHFAESNLKEYETPALEKAVEAALLGVDRQTRRGAARFWIGWQSPLEKWAPAKPGRLYSIVLTMQQESRFNPLRVQALDHLGSWRDDLPPGEFDTRLAAGLRDPDVQVRRKAMMIAGRMRHEPSAALLMDVLNGKAVETQPLPKIPDWETRDVGNYDEEVASKSSDAEVAALALATMKHQAALPVIQAKQPATPMFEVARALLGDGNQLKPEYFASPDENQELQLAAVGAVIRSRGRFGLKMAMDYRQATHWWEEEYVTSQLTDMLIREKAEGSEQLKKAKRLRDLKEWFKVHGDKYLSRLTDPKADPKPK